MAHHTPAGTPRREALSSRGLGPRTRRSLAQTSQLQDGEEYRLRTETWPARYLECRLCQVRRVGDAGGLWTGPRR
jgi:hypothetical protein